MIRFEDIPDDINGDVLRRMRSAGDSLETARDIDFTVVLPDEPAAIAFCGQLTAQGMRASCAFSEAADYLPWDVTVTKFMVPRHGDITAEESHLASLASVLGGELDGWVTLNIKDLPADATD
jgi:hypothetical protein